MTNVQLGRMLIMKSALFLETKGLKHSRGSVCTLVKSEFGLKGGKDSVYRQFCEIVEQAKQNHLIKA